MMLIIVGVENGQEEVSNFCSSPGENSYEGLYSLDVTDEHSAADGEVGRRLNQMVPIPVSLLRLYELIEHKVQGDGNCQCMFLQFRALSDQLYQTPEHHEFVRQQVVDQVVIFLSFWAEVHYNSIYPEGGKYIVFPMSQWETPTLHRLQDK
ncbi:hypothetical protein B296_00001754 [Ensete ventricosum]|uniref:Uncharacterized protein n=1 Tax=Ensete ventricosum TaxID=4639 RepID=A0A427A3A5_ENSVE|nr:hypothetical protein B296_00001754 [Ensete ventricosum]